MLAKRRKPKVRLGRTGTASGGSPTPASPPPTHAEAERRQLTVMFCDLVGSTALSEQLDPEELREVVQAYQETCTERDPRYEGHIAQHLGDGLLVYFGYPAAHEDDAPRAVRAALGIVAALQRCHLAISSYRTLASAHRHSHRASRHRGDRQQREARDLALGETPNIAARSRG